MHGRGRKLGGFVAAEEAGEELVGVVGGRARSVARSARQRMVATGQETAHRGHRQRGPKAQDATTVGAAMSDLSKMVGLIGLSREDMGGGEKAASEAGL